MARKPRDLQDNVVYHAFNRRTDRQVLFPSAHAYDEFLTLMREGQERYKVRICSYCLMDSHWHHAVWTHPSEGATAVSRYFQWLSTTHAVRFRIATKTRGHGHVYQDRFKALPVYDDRHYLTLVRYIEANPLDAGLVARAEHWPWSSLSERISGRRRVLDSGPVLLPPNWVEIVNAPENDDCDPISDWLARLAR